jgi:hypothetical protein
MDESGIFATISLTIRRANVIVNTDPTTERVDYDLDKGPAGRDDVEGDDLNYDTRSGAMSRCRTKWRGITRAVRVGGVHCESKKLLIDV